MTKEKDYTAQDEAVIRRESNRIERNRVKAEALEENAKKGLAQAIRDAQTKKALGQEALKAVKRYESGEDRYSRDRLAKAESGINVDDNEVVTGLEDRYWEK